LAANPSLEGSKLNVFFYSDGEDSVHSAALLTKLIRDLPRSPHQPEISFITGGIGSGFPTKIAIQIRDTFHTVCIY
jgi:hypothetical protein